MSSLRRFLVVTALVWGGSSTVFAAPGLGPRRVMQWEPLAALPAHAFSGTIRIKFQDGTLPVLTGTTFHDGARVLLDLADRPTGLELLAAGPWWDGDRGFLEKLRGLAMDRCRCDVADLRTYAELRVRGPWGAVQAWLARLNAGKDVEVAYPVARLMRRPADLPPTTASYVEGQTYLGPAPDGLGVSVLRALPGGDGAGVEITDMEVDWTADHEDLDGCAGSQIPGVGTIEPNLPYQDYAAHGTAVLSMLLGRDNGFGVTGFAPAAGCHYAPEYTTERGTDAPRALLKTMQSGLMDAGDVFLMESQTAGPGYNETTGEGLIPTEWEPGVYDTVRTMVAVGVVVVAAAGNGYANLDDPKYGTAFNRSVADSGAIIVGAAVPPGVGGYPARSRLDFSNYGSRVDVQGWGIYVVSAGYGDLWSGGGDIRQYYSQEFAGTSSASPMVAGAAALLQAVQQAGGGAPIPPTEVRDAFTRTGTAQGGNTAEHIGPQPDLAAAADAVVVCGNTRRDRTEVCDDGNATAGDGCSADCRSDEKCGNRVVDAVRTEACDDGNTVDGDGCSADCRSNETCGNGTVDPAVGEVCDDGNTSAGDGCAADCRSDETCGNGVVDDAADEQCDDGNTDDWDGCNRKCRKLPPGVPPGCTGATPWAPALLVLLRARRRRSPGRP